MVSEESEIEANNITYELCLDLAYLAAEQSGAANLNGVSELANSHAAEGQLWLALAQELRTAKYRTSRYEPIPYPPVPDPPRQDDPRVT